MKPLRREKVSAFLRNEVARIIQHELKDPRVGEFVSVLEVEPSADLTEAQVRVSILGSPSEQRTVMRGLEAARGYIQTLLGDRTHFRRTPQLRFLLDERIQKSMDLDALIQRARDEDDEAAGARESRRNSDLPP